MTFEEAATEVRDRWCDLLNAIGHTFRIKRLMKVFTCGDSVIGGDYNGTVEHWQCSEIKGHRGKHSNGKRTWIRS